MGKEQKAPEKKPAARRKKGSALKRLKLLVTVVNRDKSDFYMDFLESNFEINMQFATHGYGTVPSDMVNLLGLSETDKGVIFSVIREDKVPAALAMLEEKFSTVRGGKGIACTLPFSGMIGVAVYSFLCNERSAIKD